MASSDLAEALATARIGSAEWREAFSASAGAAGGHLARRRRRIPAGVRMASRRTLAWPGTVGTGTLAGALGSLLAAVLLILLARH